MFNTFFLVSLIFVNCVLGTPWEPEPRPDQNWLNRHANFVENTRRSNGSIPILFYGASIVDFWENAGREVWDEVYAPLGSVNYGIAGDKIEHVLWRILNGEIDGLSPKLIALQIGGNNISGGDNDEDIVTGITKLVQAFRHLLPTTKILIFGIPPRREIGDLDTFVRVANYNIMTSKLDNGNSIRFLNMMDQFAISWGVVRPELYEDDKLHFVLAGYQVWHMTMSRLFNEMLQE